uniref:Uncharacterized protein n=1 Tax=Treubia lacunosa TaxID=93845 RepID=G4Y9W1_9MARC|nr:hypothetical protein TrlaMp59 [Treubia lacunosa]AEH99754.1 hypothetical protein TrlaMp59 [Treubia lacunosa]
MTIGEFKQWAMERNSDLTKENVGEDPEAPIKIRDNFGMESKESLKVAFPKQTPFSSDLICLNLVPTILATKMKTCVFASATYEKHHMEYLSYAVKNKYKAYYIPRPDTRKLDHLLIYTCRSDWFNFPQNIALWPPLLEFLHTECFEFQVFNFVRCNNTARRIYETLSGVTCRLGLIEGSTEFTSGTYRTPHNAYNDKNPNFIIKSHVSSSLGVIGTGVNLPERKLMFLQTNPYKPTSAFWYAESVDDVQQHMLQDLVTTCTQNLGRFMRFTPEEASSKDVKSRRAVFLMSRNEIPGLLPVLIRLASDNFYETDVIQLDKLEDNISNLHRRTKTHIAKSHKNKDAIPGLHVDADSNGNNNNSDEIPEQLLMSLDKVRFETVKTCVNWIKGGDADPKREYETLIKSFHFEDWIIRAVKVYLKENADVSWRKLYRKFNLQRLNKTTIYEIENKFKEVNKSV